jgi:hypothetical protein
MKKTISAILRKLISPAFRFELRETAAYIAELRSRACLWRWEFAELPHRDDRLYNILYAGRKEKRKQAMALLGIDGIARTHGIGKNISPQTVFVSEVPIPGALRVPHCLNTVVTLGRPLEEIIAGYDSELRRLIRKQRSNYSIRNELNDAEIDRINIEMLKPYASARHDDSAVQLETDTVQKLAQPEFGRLDVVRMGDKPVACHLGCSFIRSGKRYWSTVRFGYPETVFSDRKLLREANSMTTYLALEWAHNNGFDCYSIGISLGRPDGGLLQWKRRRKGALDTIGNHGYFYVRLPKVGVAQFLWDAPLFAIMHGKLTLHLGIPDGPGDEEIMSRYREMGYSGLSTVFLYCKQPQSEIVLEKIRSLYSLQNNATTVESILAN